MYHTEKKKVSCEAISYGRFLKTVNVRFRTAKPIINPYRHENGKFCKPIFSDVFLWDGLQPEMEPHFRTTSASETGVWIWVSTHSGRHKRSNEPKTATQLQNKPHLPVLRCPIPPRDTSGTHHELMEWDSDGPRSRDCGNHQAQRQPVSSRTRAVGVWENLN